MQRLSVVFDTIRDAAELIAHIIQAAASVCNWNDRRHSSSVLTVL